MNNTLKQILMGATVVAFTACGGGGGSGTSADTGTQSGSTTGGGATTNGGTSTGGGDTTGGGTTTGVGATTGGGSTEEPQVYGDNVVGIAQFGLLKNAQVIIAKIPLGGGSPKLVFEETTTDGDIHNAGRFNTHSSELEDKTYYIYAIKGGIDIDADSDGIQNTPDFNNKDNAIGAIVRGEWLKELGSKAFRITPLSTHILNISDRDIDSYSGITNNLNATAKSYLKSDVNGDAELDMKDILIYNPLTNKENIKDVFNDLIKRSVVFKQKLLVDYPNINKYDKIATLKTKTAGTKTMLSKDDKYLYLSTLSAGFQIIDVSEPYDLYETGFLDDDFDDFELSADGKTLYGVSHGGGFSIVNIEDPTSPQLIVNYKKVNGKGENGYTQIVLSNDNTKAYVMSTNTLEVLDIKDFNNINRLSRTTMSFSNGFTFRLGGLYKSKDDLRVYVGGEFGLSEIETVNISNPSSPTLMGAVKYYPTLSLPEDFDRRLTSDKAYLYLYSTNGVIDVYKK